MAAILPPLRLRARRLSESSKVNTSEAPVAVEVLLLAVLPVVPEAAALQAAADMREPAHHPV